MESFREFMEQREAARLTALRVAGKMCRVRIICNGRCLGSIEIEHGYIGSTALAFRLKGAGEQVAFGYVLYQVDEDRNPVAWVDNGEDAGFFTLEQFIDVPEAWIDRLSEFPDFQAIRPKRIIELGDPR